MRPLKDLVFVRPTARPTLTASGLSLVESAWTPEFTGTVRAVGPDATDLRVGDRVVFGLQNGLETEIEHETLYVMRESDVLGVFEV